MGKISLLALVLLPLILVGARGQDDPTSGMAARLAKLAAAADPDRMTYLNSQRAKLVEQRLEAAKTDPGRYLGLLMSYGIELIQAGRTEHGLRALQLFGNIVAKNKLDPDPRTRKMYADSLTTGFLRLAEEQNCVAHHGPDSCLMPFSGSGLHGEKTGALNAIRVLTRTLAEEPGSLANRWLLNLAHMTLGQYPEGVPEALRIPPEVFASDADIGRFWDIAPQLGLATVGLSGGAALDDFDGDGDLDAICSSWGLTDQLRYYRNEGDGTFAEATDEAGLTGLTGGLNLIHADYDNDGDLDVLILRGAWLGAQGRLPNSLLRNDGRGRFTDVTEAAGLLSYHPTQTASWADFDGDGDLDLFIGNETTGPNETPEPGELFRNDGDGTFTECAAAAGLAVVGFVKGVTWGDYDGDGDPDLYVSRLAASNLLFRNDGPTEATPQRFWSFTEVAQQAGVAEPAFSFPCWFWDYDNDGALDLYVMSFDQRDALGDVAATYLGQPGHCETPRLYRNLGNGRFEDVTKSTRLAEPRLAMGSNFGDLDNDGWLDCYVGTGEPQLQTLIPNRMFRNDGQGGFQDVTTSGGFGHVQKGHGVAFGDVDGDGDQDIYVVIGGAYEGDTYQNALFLNPGHGHRWLTLRLVGVKANRAAIGACIAVVVREGETTRTIRSTVSTGGTFGSSSVQQEIGLGSADAVERIEIVWPGSGTVDVITDVPLDRVLRIEEGAKKAVVVAAPKIDLSRFIPERK